MQYLRLYDDTTYPILDYATPGNVDIILDDVTEREVLSSLTEENLSEIQFMTDSGAVTGVYRNQLLCGYVDHGDSLEIHTNDADLVRHGLILDENNRIISAVAQRYAPADAIIVDKLPDGEYIDYLYIDGEYIYDPLPIHDEPDPQPTQLDRIEAQVLYTALMTDTLIEEV